MNRLRHLVQIASIAIAAACAGCDVVSTSPPGATHVVFDLRTSKTQDCRSVAKSVTVSVTDSNRVYTDSAAGDPLSKPVRVSTPDDDEGFSRSAVTFSASVKDSAGTSLFHGSITRNLSRANESIEIPLKRSGPPVLQVCKPEPSAPLSLDITNRGSRGLPLSVRTRLDSMHSDPRLGCFDASGTAIHCVNFTCQGVSLEYDTTSFEWRPPEKSVCRGLKSETGVVALEAVVVAPPGSPTYGFAVTSDEGNVDFDIVPSAGKRTTARLELAK